MADFRVKLLGLDEDLIRQLPHLEKVALDVVNQLRCYDAGLADPNRPIGIFLLIGTTAQNPLPYALAKILYDEPPRYLAMQEFAEARHQPLWEKLLHEMSATARHRVLILGDIDLAHPTIRASLADLFHLDRFIRAGEGVSNFSDSIFFMTTQLASHLLNSPDALNDPATRQQMMDILYGAFEIRFITPLDLILPCFDK